MRTKTLLVFVSPILLCAQPVPPAPSRPAGTPAPDSTVVLSPFEVSAERDTGYIPERDLSGTRLNTPLRDVAAPITVFTRELLDDIGAISVADVIPFLPNATHETLSADASDSSYFLLRIRGRSASNTNLTDSFAEYSDLDRYKLERIGSSPGANAILQGVGNPAGTLTSSTKVAGLQRHAYTLESTFTTWGGARGMVDANRVLVPDRLALRAVVLQQFLPTQTKPAYKKDRRLYLTGTATLLERPAATTTLRAKYEWMQAASNPGNTNVVVEDVSAWLAAGQPLRTGPNTATAPTVTGATSRIGANTFIDIPGLPLMNWATALQSNGTTAPAFDERISPYDISVKGKSGIMRNKTHQGTVTLDQRLGRDLFVQAAAFHAAEVNIWPIKLGNGATIKADPNGFLPNGQPNPNAGKFYIQHDGRTDTRTGTRDAFKLQAVYAFDFRRVTPTLGRWLGRHQLFGFFQRDEEWRALERLQTVNTRPLPGLTPNLASAANRINHRSYLDYARGVYWFEAYDYRDVIEKEGFRIQAMPVLQQTTSLIVNHSRSLALNSQWWDGRIVTLVGLRDDATSSYTAKPVTDPVTGLTPLARTAPVTFDVSGRFKPVSKGVVFHALRWLSFAYNESDNFAGGASQLLDHYGRNLPTEGGQTRDYGIRLNLFADRLALSLNKYESGSVNSPTNGDEGALAEINRIWDALGEPAKRIADFPTTRETFDNLARGYELSLTFNPTRSWRFYVSAAKNNTTRTNVYPAFREYVAQHLPAWRQRAALVTTSGRTVQQEIDGIQNDVNSALSQEGVQEFNLREYTGSFVGSYSFREGWAKGVKLSATVQHFGAAIVGVPVIGVVSFPERAFVEKGYSLVGLGGSYTRRLRGRLEWFASVQVRNALDYDGRVVVISRSADALGQPLKAQWVPGTNATLTTGLRF